MTELTQVIHDAIRAPFAMQPRQVGKTSDLAERIARAIEHHYIVRPLDETPAERKERVIAGVRQAVDARLDDGTPVMTVVLARRPDLALRLRDWLQSPPRSKPLDIEKSYSDIAAWIEDLPALCCSVRLRYDLSIRVAARQIDISASALARFEAGENVRLAVTLAVLRWLDRTTEGMAAA